MVAVPTDNDIVEYAAFLHLDLDNEPELAWSVDKNIDQLILQQNMMTMLCLPVDK